MTSEATAWQFYPMGWHSSAFSAGNLYGADLRGAPDQSVVKVIANTLASARYLMVEVSACPYCPEVTVLKSPATGTTGIDGATTVAVSCAAYGYKGLKCGVWENPFLASDAQAQTLANLIATMNLEPRAPYEFSTKFNPKYEPGDIFPVTFFDELTAANCEVAEIEHVIDLRPGGGGASTTLRVRRWTA